jgi:RHS repeat-associated protein
VAGQSTTKDTPFLFAGGWTDQTYDLVNFGARWYDPREQNFLSTEPLLEESPYAAVDDPSLLAAYTYASSNPLRYVDPDGRANRAVTGFDLGDNHEKHQQGHITISVARRENREAPKITFGGRYSNNQSGQELSDAFQKHSDRADRFSTILSISTEDGVQKIRVFGITAKKTQVGDQASPGNSPADSGAAANAGPQPPPRPQNGAPPPPAANDAANQPAGAPADGGGPGDDGAGAANAAAPPPPAADGGQNNPPPPAPQPPPRPAAAAPAADGPDLDG